MTSDEVNFAVTDLRVRFGQLLEHVQSATPRAVLERNRIFEKIVAMARELVAQLPKCEQCNALATHSDKAGHGRRCDVHKGPGWLSFPRAQAQTKLVAMLEEQDYG